jgi:hypothetical protein
MRNYPPEQAMIVAPEAWLTMVGSGASIVPVFFGFTPFPIYSGMPRRVLDEHVI